MMVQNATKFLQGIPTASTGMTEGILAVETCWRDAVVQAFVIFGASPPPADVDDLPFKPSPKTPQP